jgi:hypothetical protein
MAVHGKELAEETEELRFHRFAFVASRRLPMTFSDEEGVVVASNPDRLS